MNGNYYAILMAGGIGSRFWPVSTTEFPKQFQDMLGSGETLIQKTFSRLSKIVPHDNILVLTNEKYSGLVAQQLPMISPDRIVREPEMRNTAPCILYATAKIQKLNPDAIILVAPSDHWIEDEAAFVDNVQKCFDHCATHDALLTLGITPTFPNTGYGYIEYEVSPAKIKKVSKFTEKPDYATAKVFFESDNYLWNGGIFIWSATSILRAFEKFTPEMFALFMHGADSYNTGKELDFIAANYADAENISIDYAIMEHADNVYVYPSDFDWNDLGTWGSLHEKLPKDANNNAVVNATVILENAKNNIIRTERPKLIVIDGLTDYIIVDKDDVLLIYPKSKEQNIKDLISKIDR